MTVAIVAVFILLCTNQVTALIVPYSWSTRKTISHTLWHSQSSTQLAARRRRRRRRRVKTLTRPDRPTMTTFRFPDDPEEELQSAEEDKTDTRVLYYKDTDSVSSVTESSALANTSLSMLIGASILTLVLSHPDATWAADSVISKGSLDPQSFVPVCPASDGFYRLLQSTTQTVVGRESFVEYGPLIAGGLLRVRLELCVVESFVNEAVIPFVQKNGISWILPLHETVETFLAGVIFSLATVFILIGSTKIVTIIITYTDFIIGLPARLFGGFAYDRALGKPVTLDIGLGPFKTRLVGPPVKEGEEEGSKDIDLTSLSPLNLATVIVSGGVKFTGEALGVSDFVFASLLVTAEQFG